jgi:hypothetical protein
LDQPDLRTVVLSLGRCLSWRYQEIGETLWHDGWAGLIPRSAARPEAFVVSLFAADWPPSGCVPERAIEIKDAPVPPAGTTT